jgi:trehalose 6-phosphate phosphatase
MFASKTEKMHNNDDYISPQGFLNFHIYSQENYCLFLDIDGTISEFHVDPNKSYIDKNVLNNIQELIDVNIPVVAVTGRTIQDASRLFYPINLPIAGTHGLEIQINPNEIIQRPKHQTNFEQLYIELVEACLDYPKLTIEKKKHSIALHFRKYPNLQDIAYQIISSFLESYPELHISRGKCVYELILRDANKGKAIQKIYDYLKLHHYIPIFLGDDVTDEFGFDAINHLNGISIKIGEGKTNAQYRLRNVTQAKDFIGLFTSFSINKKYTSEQTQTVFSLTN